MTILYPGNVTAKQTCALFDVALGEFLFLAHFAQTVANYHARHHPTETFRKQVMSPAEKSRIVFRKMNRLGKMARWKPRIISVSPVKGLGRHLWKYRLAVSY